MSQKEHHTVFNELLNRYDSLFVSVIGKHFPLKRLRMYIKILIHLLFPMSQTTKVIWTSQYTKLLKAVVSNYCICIAKRNAKKKFNFLGWTQRLENYSEKDDSIESIFNSKELNLSGAMNYLLLPKKILILVKYFYGRCLLNSTEIKTTINVYFSA